MATRSARPRSRRRFRRLRSAIRFASSSSTALQGLRSRVTFQARGRLSCLAIALAIRATRQRTDHQQNRRPREKRRVDPKASSTRQSSLPCDVRAVHVRSPARPSFRRGGKGIQRSSVQSTVIDARTARAGLQASRHLDINRTRSDSTGGSWAQASKSNATNRSLDMIRPLRRAPSWIVPVLSGRGPPRSSGRHHRLDAGDHWSPTRPIARRRAPSSY